jgi:ribosomal protein L37AE/L43A
MSSSYDYDNDNDDGNLWHWNSNSRVFSRRPKIGVIGTFDYQKETLEVPNGAIFVEGRVFCPERHCGRELVTRKADGLRFCPDCRWGWQDTLMSPEEKARKYKRHTTIRR